MYNMYIYIYIEISSIIINIFISIIYTCAYTYTHIMYKHREVTRMCNDRFTTPMHTTCCALSGGGVLFATRARSKIPVCATSFHHSNLAHPDTELGIQLWHCQHEASLVNFSDADPERFLCDPNYFSQAGCTASVSKKNCHLFAQPLT